MPGPGGGSRAPFAPYYDKCAGHVSVCDQPKQDGVGSYAHSICQRTFPDRRGSLCDTGTQSSPCGALHDRNGPVAPYQCSGISWTHPDFLLQPLHGLRGLFSRCPAVMNLLPQELCEEMYIQTLNTVYVIFG